MTLRIRSTRPAAFHPRGYDLWRQVTPGQVATLTFRVRRSGHFPIDDEVSRTILGMLVVRPRQGR